MRKKIVLILALSSLIISVESQVVHLASNTSTKGNESSAMVVSPKRYTFKFMAMPQSTFVKDITNDMIDNHVFGEDIAKMQYSFNKYYCSKEPVAPGNFATKTIIKKPDIFHSVKKIESFLKNQYKKGEITLAMAHDEYSKVLDTALNVVDENTGDFENRLNSAKGKAEVLLSIYINEVELDKVN
ncbi:MAG: hypothetical protein H6Q14_2302 [Bacteroidetes bacterium]|nr:hypothetical protein [Bacteroidota bacterium]